MTEILNYENYPFGSPVVDLHPDKKTLSKMDTFERMDYLNEHIQTGNVVLYETQTKSVFGSNIRLYHDKILDVYTEVSPWTGSFYRDISKEDFENFNINDC